MPVTPLNGPWALLVIGVALLGVASHYALRRRSFRVRRIALLVLAVVTLLCSLAFHLAYLLAPPPEGFPLFQNLPFHLCTVMSWLMPLTVWFDFKPLRAVAFFPGALAGMLALCSAAPMYWGHELADPKTFFWVAHELNAVVPFLLASLGLYRPTLRAALMSTIWVTVLGVLILPITLALRAWVDPDANYFYVFDPQGAGILEILHQWIGVPILYVLPLPFLLLPILIGQWAVYRAANWRPRRVVIGSAA